MQIIPIELGSMIPHYKLHKQASTDEAQVCEHAGGWNATLDDKSFHVTFFPPKRTVYPLPPGKFTNVPYEKGPCSKEPSSSNCQSSRDPGYVGFQGRKNFNFWP